MMRWARGKLSGIKCWDDIGTSTPTPTDVSGLTSGVASITAGISNACALMTSGGVKCWGGNIHGQLGDGTTNTSATPVDVVGLDSGVASISAGGVYFVCVTMASGGVKCWGGNDDGQLGVGLFGGTYRTPTDVFD